MDEQKQQQYFCMCVPLGQNVDGEESRADTCALVMRMLVKKDDEYFLEHLVDAGSSITERSEGKNSEKPKRSKDSKNIKCSNQYPDADELTLTRKPAATNRPVNPSLIKLITG